ncbi:MAG: hypothetical protein ACT4QF_15490 [Sporichthyaceae bacterium]
MTRYVVAAQFRWDEYPGLRPGRIFSGAGDVGRSPLGEAHLVEGPAAPQTLCGLPRSKFPLDFPAVADFRPPAEACAGCDRAR